MTPKRRSKRTPLLSAKGVWVRVLWVRLTEELQFSREQDVDTKRKWN